MAEALQVEAKEKRLLTDPEYSEGMKTCCKEASEDFMSFLYLLWPQTPEQAYKLGDFHLFLAKFVQEVLSGRRSPNAAVSAPPQHGKSRLIAVRAVAWILGAYPGISVALTGFSYSLLTEFMHEIQAIVESPGYKLVFPEMNTMFGRDRADSKNFSNGSSLLAKSAGSKLTGRRVDVLIVDDPHAGREEAESIALRDKVRRWYFADCVSRLSPNAKQFLIMTRWHPEDLVGSLTDEDYVKQLETEGYSEMIFDVVNLPAIAHVDDPMGREEGEALFPEQRPLKFLLGKKASIPTYEWNSQFDGNPQSSGSGQTDAARIRRIALQDVPFGRLEVTRGWDLALTLAKTSDYTAGALLGYDKVADLLYIIDMFHGKLVWTDTRKKIVQLALNDKQQWGLQRIGLEAVTGFSIGLDELRKDLAGEVRIEKKNPRTDKMLRARPWLNKIDAGKVLIVDGPWTRTFLNELEQFPDGKNDDQIDSVSVGYEVLTSTGTMVYA